MSPRATAAALALVLLTLAPTARAATPSPYLLVRGALPVNDQTFSDFFDAGWGGALGVDVPMSPAVDATVEVASESYGLKLGAPTGTAAIVSGDDTRVSALMAGATYHARRATAARAYVRFLFGLEHATRVRALAHGSLGPDRVVEWPADIHVVSTLGVGFTFRRGKRHSALRAGIDAMLGGSSRRKTGRFTAGLGLGW